MATANASVDTGRFDTIRWAVILAVGSALLGLPALLLPGSDELGTEVFVVTAILAVVTAIGGWGCGTVASGARSRWASRPRSTFSRPCRD